MVRKKLTVEERAHNRKYRRGNHVLAVIDHLRLVLESRGCDLANARVVMSANDSREVTKWCSTWLEKKTGAPGSGPLEVISGIPVVIRNVPEPQIVLAPEAHKRWYASLFVKPLMVTDFILSTDGTWVPPGRG
jgi:hypothetical protein